MKSIFCSRYLAQSTFLFLDALVQSTFFEVFSVSDSNSYVTQCYSYLGLGRKIKVFFVFVWGVQSKHLLLKQKNFTPRTKSTLALSKRWKKFTPKNKKHDSLKQESTLRWTLCVKHFYFNPKSKSCVFVTFWCDNH